MPKIILKNIKGRHGKDGEQGPQGLQGDQGPKGDQGIQGDAGRDGLRGLQGELGPQGQSGKDGSQGLSGAQGGIGPQGEKGDKGEVPDHKWSGEELQFQNPDGTWGKKVNLKGAQGAGFVGGGPSSAGIQYTKIESATYTFTDRDLVPGHNIFGVNFSGDVTITIPTELNPEKLIVVKDESGSASSNNITIKAA